jgi:hypothetical protein
MTADTPPTLRLPPEDYSAGPVSTTGRPVL